MKRFEISLKKANDFKGWNVYSRFLSDSNRDTATTIECEGEYAILHSIGYSVYLGIFASVVKVIDGKVQQNSEIVGLLDILTEEDYSLIYEMLEELALVPLGNCLSDEESLHEFFGGYFIPTTEQCTNKQIEARRKEMFVPIVSQQDLDHLFGLDGKFRR